MHLEVLTPPRKVLFGRLAAFNGFYLAGGTAIALQLGHRQSIDFDLFTDQPIPQSLLRTVEAVFSGETVSPLVNNSDELTVTINNTKLTFLTYPFPVLRGFVDSDGVRLLTIPELAATKAYTIGRRGSFKDYVDLHAILTGAFSTLGEIIELADDKYQDAFNARLFLEQLVWLDDVDAEPLLFLGQPIDKATAQHFFETAVRQFRIGDSAR